MYYCNQITTLSQRALLLYYGYLKCCVVRRRRCASYPSANVDCFIRKPRECGEGKSLLSHLLETVWDRNQSTLPGHTQVRPSLSWTWKLWEIWNVSRRSLQCRVILSPKLQLVRLVQCSVGNVWILSLKYYAMNCDWKVLPTMICYVPI